MKRKPKKPTRKQRIGWSRPLGPGQTSIPIAWNASAATIQEAFRKLTSRPSGVEALLESNARLKESELGRRILDAKRADRIAKSPELLSDDFGQDLNL